MTDYSPDTSRIVLSVLRVTNPSPELLASLVAPPVNGVSFLLVDEDGRETVMSGHRSALDGHRLEPPWPDLEELYKRAMDMIRGGDGRSLPDLINAQCQRYPPGLYVYIDGYGRLE